MKKLTGLHRWMIQIALVALLVAGCGDQSDSESSSGEAPVLRKKIIAPQAKPRSPAQVSGAAKAVRPQPDVAVAQVNPSSQPGDLHETTPPAEQPRRTSPPGIELSAPPSPDKKPIAGGAAAEEPAAAPTAVATEPTPGYDPAGKPDPFKPLFEPEEIGTSAPVRKTVAKDRLPLTPLQRIELGQFKLVGIILSPPNDKALVEEPSGKGYIITPGTYIGTSYGRVKEILKDRVVVEEEVEDFLSGETRLQTTELTLPKTLGER